MTKTARSLILCLALLAQVAHAQDPPRSLIAPEERAPAPAVRANLDRLFYAYDVVELPLAALDHQVKTQGRVALLLQSRVFQLELEPNDLRAEGYREVLIVRGTTLEHSPGPVITFAGRVAGDLESVVRVTATEELFAGYIKTGDEWLFIDPLRDYVPRASTRLAVVYRASDVRPEAIGQCGLELLGKAGRAFGLTSGGAKNHNTLRRLDVATDGDGEYYQRYGVAAFDRITAIVNGVDGIYRGQINLFLRITFQQLWTDPATDPYTSATDIIATINQLTNWWNANRGGVNRDVAHLFSGKSFSTFIGYAWIAVVCSTPSLSYSVSQDYEPLFIRVELMAHELGHNLAATHDDQSPVCPGVNCNGFGPIMCSVIQGSGSNTFSTCSKNQIDTHTHNNGACLN